MKCLFHFYFFYFCISFVSSHFICWTFWSSLFFCFFFGTKFIPFTNYAIFSFSYSKPSAGCDLPRRFYEDRELTVFFKNAYVPMSNQANLVEACKKMSFCICFSFLLFFNRSWKNCVSLKIGSFWKTRHVLK